jgi:hypothetical protein
MVCAIIFYFIYFIAVLFVNELSRLAFYYPFVGLINLFIYILKYPTLPSALSDVALMDVITGHFGRVEFITSAELAFPFIREITSLANKMVKKAKMRIIPEPPEEPMVMTSSGLMDEPMSSFGLGTNEVLSIKCRSLLAQTNLFLSLEM